ncbi:F-box protein, partial [Cucurbita argyrosperma subsp. sororia]
MARNGDDLISFLPDEMLRLVLSLLPFESAVETSLLSSRWRRLWNSALVRFGAIDDVAQEVASFFNHFNQLPIKHPRRLQYHFGKDGLLLASIAADDKLHLDFSGGSSVFPWQFDWELKFDTHNPSPFAFNITSLCLKSVSCLTNQAVSSLVSSIRVLESLRIDRCCGFQSLCVGSSPKLSRLTVLDCLDLSFLHIRCSNLQSFRFRGRLPRIRLESHFNLQDAMLDFREGLGCSNLKISEFDPCLLTIKNAATLTLCGWNYEALIWPSIASLQGNFIFYHLKELWWIGYSNEEHNSNALLSFLQMCPALERLFVTIDPKSYSTPSKPMYSKNVWRRAKSEHLKLVSLKGFTDENEEMSLIKVIKEVVCVSPVFISAIDHSTKAEKHGSNGGNSSSKLDDEQQIWPKHPHMNL